MAEKTKTSERGRLSEANNQTLEHQQNSITQADSAPYAGAFLQRFEPRQRGEVIRAFGLAMIASGDVRPPALIQYLRVWTVNSVVVDPHRRFFLPLLRQRLLSHPQEANALAAFLMGGKE